MSNTLVPDWLKAGKKINFECFSADMQRKVLEVTQSEDGVPIVHIEGFNPLKFDPDRMTPIKP